MVVIHSTSGSVVTFSSTLCTYSCTSLSLASMAFIFGSPMRYVHTYALSSQSFVHSSSTLLMLETIVVSILTLPSCTSGGNVNSNLVQYLLQTDIQKKNRKDTMENTNITQRFFPWKPKPRKPTYSIFIHCVTMFTIQNTYRSQWHPKP
jgi:hypothetical protein